MKIMRGQEKTLGRKTLSGLIWSFTERFSIQCLNFVVLIIMARILTPSDYGLVGMTGIFIAIAHGLVDFGFSQSIIRKGDYSRTDLSTVFWFNLGVSVILYGTLYMTAGIIADFYSRTIVKNIVRVIGLLVPVTALTVVPRAILTVSLNFRAQALTALIAGIISGGTGIWMAYNGFGVWSIVWCQLLHSVVICLGIWIFSNWLPEVLFSLSSFRHLAGFGSKVAVAGFMETLYVNLYGLVIGKFYNASDVGFYSRANQFSSFLTSNISHVIQRVSYPVLCRVKDDAEKMKESFSRFLGIATFIVFPLSGLLIITAHPLVNILLTEKWAYAADLIPILCLSLVWYPVQAINLNLLLAAGRSDLFLRLEIIKKIISVLILVITVPCGIEAICWGRIADALISLKINSYYSHQFGGTGLLSQLKRILPIAMLTILACLAGVSVMMPLHNDIFKLIAGGITTLTIFILLAKVTDSKDLHTIEGVMRRRDSMAKVS